LPELLTTTDAPEVSISLGKVPEDTTSKFQNNKVCRLIKNQFLLRVAGVGCFYVTNGNSIVVEPAEQAEEGLVRLFLLGTTFGALLMQRGILPVHGSAVIINGYSVIFTGVSGSGKSTLLAALRKKGYSFLTDDVAAVTVDADGIPWVHPAYPQQKLWRDSTETMDVDTSSLTPFYTGIEKDKFAVPAHKGFCQSPVPLAAVYEIEAAKCRDVTVRPLASMEKLSVLISHTYRPWLVDGLGIKAAHFKQCVAIARQVNVSRLTRPQGIFSLEEQVRLIKEDFSRQHAARA
jgi:hypothetical protein